MSKHNLLYLIIGIQIIFSTSAFATPVGLDVENQEAQTPQSTGAAEQPGAGAMGAYIHTDVPLGNLLALSPAIGLTFGVGTQTIGAELGVYTMQNSTNTTSGRFARAVTRFPGLGPFKSTVRLGVAREDVAVRVDSSHETRLSGVQVGYDLISSPPPKKSLGRLETTGVNFGFGQILFRAPFVAGFDVLNLTVPVATHANPASGETEKRLHDNAPSFSLRVGSVFFGFYF
jgi:hypothetical protein